VLIRWVSRLVIASAMSRLVVLVAATVACTAGVAPVRAPAPIELRSAAPLEAIRRDTSPQLLRGRRDVDLWSTTAMPDRGLLVAGRSHRGVASGGHSYCVTADDSFVIRFDAGGRALWVRCVRAAHALTAVSGSTLWVARVVIDARNAAGPHDGIRDLVAVDRWSLSDGAPIDSRVVAVWDDDPTYGAEYVRAERTVGGLQLNAVTAIHGELLLGGTSLAGHLVDGQWHVRDDSPRAGFVLGVSGDRVRSLIDGRGIEVHSVAAAGNRFVVAGTCRWLGDDEPRASACAGAAGSSLLTITGALDAPERARTRVFLASSAGNMFAAIDEDGAVVVGATLNNARERGLPPLVVDGITVESSCGTFAFVAAWSPSSALRFARALGDCTRAPPSPPADDDLGIRSPDDDRAHYLLDVVDVAVISHHAVIAIRVPEEISERGWPVRFDHVAVAVPRGHHGIVLALDDRGHVIDHLHVRHSDQPRRTSEPDATLVRNIGALHVMIAAGPQSWVVTTYADAIETPGRRFAASTGIGPAAMIAIDPTSYLSSEDCAARYLRGSPARSDDLRYHCRQYVVADLAVVALPFAPR
jgi:hypothetical protein